MKLHEAIREAYSGNMTQEELGEAIGERQSLISRWATGTLTPSLDEIAKMEDALKLPRGWILVKAGCVKVPTSVLEAIDLDPELDVAGRRVLRAAYKGLIAE